MLTLNMNLSDASANLTGSDSAVVESLSVPVGVAMAETLGGLCWSHPLEGSERFAALASRA